MKFIITKEVEALSLAEALRKESEGVVIGINRPKESAEPRKLDVGFKQKEHAA